jgi:hypothetical protein
LAEESLYLTSANFGIYNKSPVISKKKKFGNGIDVTALMIFFFNKNLPYRKFILITGSKISQLIRATFKLGGTLKCRFVPPERTRYKTPAPSACTILMPVLHIRPVCYYFIGISLLYSHMVALWQKRLTLDIIHCPLTVTLSAPIPGAAAFATIDNKRTRTI